MKKTLRGHRQVLRGRSVTLARQEIWAFLTVHNMICALAAQAAALQAIDPDAISFAAVLRLVRHHFTADTCCRHCGKRPTSANAPVRPAARRRPRPPQKPDNPETAAVLARRMNDEPITPKTSSIPSRSSRQHYRNWTKHHRS